MLGPDLIGPWEDDAWRVGPTFQLVEGGGSGPYWLAPHGIGAEDGLTLNVDDTAPQALAASLVVFASALADKEAPRVVKDASESDREAARRLAPQLAKKLADRTRVGLVILDKYSALNADVASILRDWGVRTYTYIGTPAIAATDHLG